MLSILFFKYIGAFAFFILRIRTLLIQVVKVYSFHIHTHAGKKNFLDNTNWRTNQHFLCFVYFNSRYHETVHLPNFGNKLHINLSIQILDVFIFVSHKIELFGVVSSTCLCKFSTNSQRSILCVCVCIYIGEGQKIII